VEHLAVPLLRTLTVANMSKIAETQPQPTSMKTKKRNPDQTSCTMAVAPAVVSGPADGAFSNADITSFEQAPRVMRRSTTDVIVTRQKSRSKRGKFGF